MYHRLSPLAKLCSARDAVQAWPEVNIATADGNIRPFASLRVTIAHCSKLGLDSPVAGGCIIVHESL